MKLIIAGVELIFEASVAMKQNYQRVDGGESSERMSDGTLVTQSCWSGNPKLKTTISAYGRGSPGLFGIDFSEAIQVHCVAAIDITGTLPSIALPRVFRTDGDYAPRGFAIKAQERIATACVMTADVAALTPVSGAAAYRVEYYPILTVKAETPEYYRDYSNRQIGWSLSAEEI